MRNFINSNLLSTGTCEIKIISRKHQVGKNKCDFKIFLAPLFDIAPSRLWECISNVSFLPKIDRTNFYSGGPTCIPNRHCAGGRKTNGKKLRHHFSLRKGKGSELHRKCMRKFCNVLQKSRDIKETCDLVFAMCNNN